MSTPPWGEDPAGNPSDPTPPGQQPYGQQQPFGQQPPAPQQPYQPYGGPPPSVGYGYGAARPTNGMAIASLVVSIAGLLVCCGAPSIIGAILGHVARGQIKSRGDAGEGLALAGVIVGWIAFGIFILLAILYTGAFIAAVNSDDFSSDYSSDY